MANDELQTYLNDHLAGAAVAIKVLERLIGGADAPADRHFFEGLQREIEADRLVVVRLAERLEGHPSTLRQAGAWATELLTQVKLRLDDPGGHRLAYVEALEGLALGILGKRALWQALRTIAGRVPAVAGEDYEHLVARAEDQHARVETKRRAAASTVFADGQRDA